MSFDETLRQSLDALARDLSSTVEAARAEAAAAAKAEAERDIARAVAEAQAAAEQRGRDDGWQLGLEEGRAQGRDEGRKQGLDEGRAQGFEAGRSEGFAAGLVEGRQLGFQDGRAEGLQEGREQGVRDGRDQGLAEGREQGLKEGREQGLKDGREQGMLDGRKEGRADGEAAARSADLATSQRLTDGLRAVDRARSLSEVLDTLASCAGRETARVAVLLVRGSQLRGWRFIGFGPSLDDATGYEAPLAQSGIIADAVSQNQPVSADSAAPGSAPAFASLPPGRELFAVPVSMSGQVVAVLYADQGDGGREVRFAWPSTLEVIARYAARTLEAITAARAVQALMPGGQPAVSTTTDAAADEQTARRYAKLLVSEIKLYHEPEVVAGRRDRDLGTRLGGEIARARVLYEQRVPPQTRRGADFFHEELVRTLADGDESLLKVKRP